MSGLVEAASLGSGAWRRMSGLLAGFPGSGRMSGLGPDIRDLMSRTACELRSRSRMSGPRAGCPGGQMSGATGRMSGLQI